MASSTSAHPIDPQPAHARVATSLRKRIQLGVYEPDQRLPTTRALADELGVGRVTLQHAVTLLVDEGLLRTRRGRGGGTFVVGGPGPRRPREGPPEQLDDPPANYEFSPPIEPFVTRHAPQTATPG